MANEGTLFVRMFIAFFTLQLLAPVTSLIFRVIATRYLCVTGWAHQMRLRYRSAHGDAPGRLPAPRNALEALAAGRIAQVRPKKRLAMLRGLSAPARGQSGGVGGRQ